MASNWRSIFSPRTLRRNRLRPQLERLEARDAPVVKFLSSFEGMDQADGGFFEPPDTTLAVGPNRIVEEINTAIALYDKGGKQLAMMRGEPFFGKTSNDFVFDPVAVFDEYAQRFVVAQLQLDQNNNKSYLLVAVSNTASPNGLAQAEWTDMHTIEMTETDGGGNVYWADYPKLGYNREAYVFTFNMFGFSGGQTHARVLSIDKSSLLDQNASTVTSFASNPTGGLFTMCAAAMHDAPANSPMWFTSQTGGTINVVQMTNILSNTPNYVVTPVAVNAWSAPPPATQPDGSQVSSVGPRMLNSAWRGDRLVSAHAVDGGDGQPKVAWYEFSTAGTPTKTQEGRINPGPGVATYIPGVEITPAGGIGVTYMQCDDSSEFVSMYMTGQQKGKPAGFMDPAIQIFAGKANYTGGRQGDYSGIQIDPVDGTFWAANEFTVADGSWTTGIGQIQLGVPPVITSLSVDPNPVNQGQIVTLVGSFTDADSPNDSFTVDVDWGDGTAPSQVKVPVGRRTFSVQHQIFNAGGTVVTVGVTDQDGNTGNGTVTINAFGTAPIAKITGAPLGLVDENKKVSLGSFVTHPNPGENFSYFWRVLKNGAEFATSTNAGISFVPDDNGAYFVTLTVGASGGVFGDAAPVQITAKNVAPKASQLINDGPKMTGQQVHVSFQGVTDAQADVNAGLQFQFDTNGDNVYDTAWLANPFVDVNFPAEGFFTLKGHIRDKDLGISQDYFTDVLISNTGGGNGGIVTTRYIAAGSEASQPGGITVATSLVQVFNLDGTVKFSNLRPLGQAYTGGYRVATGDVNGDKVEDIIVGPGLGGGSTIIALDGATGNEIFNLPNVFGATFNSGVYLATGDFNRDGFADIVVAPGAQPAGVIAPVKGFSGFTQGQLFSFSPFGGSRTGVTVAVADVDGDRRPDLVTGNATSGSQVKVFRYLAGGLSTAAYRTFNAMPSTYLRGVFVAAGDLDGDRKAEVIVGSNLSPGYDSKVRVFTNGTTAMTQSREFVPFAGNRLGVRVAADDLDGDGKADIIVSSAGTTSDGATQRIIGLSGLTLAGKFQQDVTQRAFLGGVYVG